MVVIIISTGYQKIQKILETYDHIHVMKRKGIQLFLYYDVPEGEGRNDLRWTKQLLTEKMGKGYVIQLFSMVNGKIDFFEDRNDSAKQNMSYYNSAIKDLSNAEIQAFLDKHPEIQNRI